VNSFTKGFMMRFLSISEKDIKNAEPKGKAAIRKEISDFLDLYGFEDRQMNKEAAFLLLKTGLDKPVVQVTKAPNAHPRAYLRFADFYYHPSGHYGIPKGHFYVSIPDSYNNTGDLLSPKTPFQTVDPSVAEIFSRGWYGSGWGAQSPAFWLSMVGTGLPEKFHVNKTVIKTTVYDPQLVFIVPKGTQSLAEDFAQVSSRVIGAEFNDVKLYSIPKNEPIPAFLNKFQRLGVRSYKWLEG